MVHTRASRPQDVPRLKELWRLAFGDGQEYTDHFFDRYYTPERMLVLEADGAVQAMTAWFDMPLVCADGTALPAAYLYAVATHPDVRGRGYAGRLLAYADGWLGRRGFACLTTVPARPDLHVFFAANGFEENFVHARQSVTTAEGEVGTQRVDAEEYGILREQFLAGQPHVAYSPEALAYQQGVCRLSGGGLYRLGDNGCACVEHGEGGLGVVKELLVSPEQRQGALAALVRENPAVRYEVRRPWAGEGERVPFGMVKWLGPVPAGWDSQNAYLGLAFD